MTSSTPSPSQLKTAAALAIVAAILYIPLTILGVISTVSQIETFKTVTNIIQLGTLAFYLYPLLTFSKLLTEKLHFTQVSSLINALIGFTLAVYLLAFVPDSGFASILALFLVFASGVIEIIIGVKLLKATDKLPGLNTVTYLFLIDGIFIASILLVFLAPLTSLLQYIFLAVLLFKTSNTATLEKKSTITSN